MQFVGKFMVYCTERVNHVFCAGQLFREARNFCFITEN